MKQQIYASYNWYDKKGRRLAVFCRYIDANTAEIFTLACSKVDQFSKKYSKQEYTDYLQFGATKNSKPTVYIVNISPVEIREIKFLQNYCKNNFYVKCLYFLPKTKYIKYVG